MDVKEIGIKFIGGLFVSYGVMNGLAIASTYIGNRVGPLLSSIVHNTLPGSTIVTGVVLIPDVTPYLIPIILVAIGLTLLFADFSSIKK